MIKTQRFKFNNSTSNTTPFLAPFLKDTLRNDEIEQLQYDKDMISAYAILTGEIKLFNNAQSGTVANQFAISPDSIGAFMGKAKQGLGKLVKLAALPVENSKFFQFTDNTSGMYSDQLANSAGVGSGISRVIYSSDRMNNAELEAGITDQYNTMKPLYYQFSNFLDFYVNQLTKTYKFHFILEGCAYGFEREDRFNRLTKLAEKGMVLAPSAWASAIGMEPQNFERSLEESKYSGWANLWQMPVNAFTSSQSSSENSEPGRPRVDDNDITDSGEASRNERNGI